MRLLALACSVAVIALAQSTQTIDDLHRRSLTALDALQHPAVAAEAIERRSAFIAKMGASLRVDRFAPPASTTAALYLPALPHDQTPAVLIALAHEDQPQILPASLARLGFAVLVLDLRPDHLNLTRMSAGLAPSGLMQVQVHAALAYLKAIPGVDPKRIGLLGDSLTSTIAMALNPEVATAAIIDGASDFRALIAQLHALNPGEPVDFCNIVPGSLEYGTTEEIIAAIAPRPLLLFRIPPSISDYANSIYSSFQVSPEFHGEPNGNLADAETRWAIYTWLCRSLQPSTGLGGFHEENDPYPSLSVRLQPRLDSSPDPRFITISEGSLESHLGKALPRGRVHFALKIARVQENQIETQLGFQLPVTIYRTGPEGGGHANGRVIAFSDQGRQSLESDPLLTEAREHNWDVWAFDPRGIGQLAPRNENAILAFSLLLGEHFVWRQATDIRRAGEYSNRIRLYAKGSNSALIAAFLGAVADPQVLERIIIANEEEISPPHPLWVPFGANGSFDFSRLQGATTVPIKFLRTAEDVRSLDW